MSTESRDYEYGRIVSVDVRTLGDNLAADAASGASTLVVEDAYDFDETGGQLVLGGVVYAYTAVDDETGTITLATTTGAAAVEGDAVDVYDPTYATASTEKVAQVEVTGDEGNVDMLECMIALHLTDKIAEGVRGTRGESVKLELDGPDWVVVDITGLGNPNSAGTQFKRDLMTVTATGAQTFPLTYEPIADSLHLRWEPINIDDTAWTRAGKVVTIPTPNYFEVGDVLTAKYAYRRGMVTPVVDYPDFVLSYNPVAYFRHGEAPASSTMVDSSGNGHHGTYYGGPTLGYPSLIASSTDTCVSLNGTNQYGRVPYASWMDAMYNGSATWLAVIQGSSGGPYAIIDRDTGAGGARVFQFRLYLGKVELVIWTATAGPFVVTGSTTLTTASIHKVGATFDAVNGVAKVFVDGAVDGTLTGITGGGLALGNIGGAPLSIGVNNSAPSAADTAWFAGQIDESALIAACLSDAEMADLAAAA
jgi:hypothetical protein